MRPLRYTGSNLLLDAARKRKREQAQEQETQIKNTNNGARQEKINDEDDDVFEDDGLSMSFEESEETSNELLNANLLIHKLLHVAEEEGELLQTEAQVQEEPRISEPTTPLESVAPTLALADAPTTEFFETTDANEQDFTDIDSMPPPTRRSSIPSVEDRSEEVPQTCSRFDVDIFQMALGLWCQDAAITRQQYSSLLEVLALLDDNARAQIKALPRSIETLRRKTQKRLPLMKIRKQRIPLIAAKLPTAGPKFSSTPMDWLYWFDPAHLIATVLASSEFKAKMHFGMAEYVDCPKELWHSPSWGASIRACSGDFAYCGPRSNNQPIFPSDVVFYRCANKQCSKTHLGRVVTIGRDYSKFAGRPGDITLQVQGLRQTDELDPSWQASFTLEKIQFPLQSKELVCIEDEFFYLLQEQIVSVEENVCLDYSFDGVTPIDRRIGQYDTYIIRRIFNRSQMLLRPLNLSPPIRAELEVAEFGRQYLINTLTNSISIPLLCFMDAFGLYRNMYRSLLGIYFIFAGLSVNERKRRSNVFPLTFGPHGSELKDICDALKPGIAALDRGLSIEINGENQVVCAFIMAWLGDMPQQQDNSGFKRQNAIRGCRFCTINSEARDQLDFDVVLQGRYNQSTLALRRREKQMTKNAWRAFCTEWGLAETHPPVASLTPALDIIRTRPTDPAHSEYAGVSKLAHDLLMHAILNANGQRSYTAQLQSFPFPPGWGRLQSPAHHLDSYRIQEHARASIIIPMLLRCWLTSHFIRPVFLTAMRGIFIDVEFSSMSPSCIITHCFGRIARSNSVVMAETMTTADRATLSITIKEARQKLQLLQKTAAKADLQKPSRSRANTRSPSPSSAPSNSLIQPASPFVVDSAPSTPGSEFVAPHLLELENRKPKVKKNKVGQYESDQRRPNMHIAVHHADIAKEYATVFNVNGLIGEDKHREAKKRIVTTNHRNVVWSLLSRENVAQTIRFLLLSAFQRSHSDVTEFMLKLHSDCPTLFQTILPRSERSSNLNESDISILPDEEHSNTAALLCIPQYYVKDFLRLPVRLAHLDIVDPFLVALRHAYSTDYQMHELVSLGNLPLQWCKKFIFTSTSLESRVSYRVDDYISFRKDGIGRLDAIFVHELSVGSRRLFAHVTRVLNYSGEDAVLGIPMLRCTEEQITIGLPAIAAKKLYIVPVEGRKNSNELRLGDAG